MLGALLVAIGCAAGPSRAESLMDVFALARENDPRYKAARFEFEAATYAEPQARAALLPTVTAELSRTETRQRILSSANPVFSTGFSQYPTQSSTLTLTQPIFKASAIIGYQQAKSKVRQATAVLNAAEQDLMLRVATAYVTALAARDALDFAQAELTAIKRQLDLVQQRFSSGIVAIASLHEARARNALKEADLIAAQNDLDDKQQALRELTGKLITDLKPLRDEIPLTAPEPADMGQWVETSLKQNLLIEARREALEVARQEVERLRSNNVPVLDLVANQGRKDTGGSLFGGGSVVATTDVMLRLSIPIFSGGLMIAQVGEAVQRREVAREDLERDTRQIERQARAAYQGVTSGIVRIRALAQGVVSSESARKLKAEGYRSGLETILQVLDAERDLYAAKRDSAKARYEYLLNRLKLKQAVGTLSDTDLAEINTWVR